MSTPAERIADWFPDPKVERGFIVEDLGRVACVVVARTPADLAFSVACDDT